MEHPRNAKLNCVCCLLKNLPMGCKDTVIIGPPLQNCTINCHKCEENTRQPYNDNLALFRALPLHLKENQRLEDKTSNCLFCSQIGWTDSAQSVPGSPHEWYSGCWRSDNTQYSVLRHRYGRWRQCWRTCWTQFAEIRKYSATTEIQQPYRFFEQHWCSLLLCSLSKLWHFLQQNIQCGVKFNQTYLTN